MDPVAILVQLLVAFGNVVGPSTHFAVEADRHRMNLFAVLVGQSAKARKGTSLGYIHGIFDGVDPCWLRERAQSGLTSGEGLIWAVRDPTNLSDMGVADKRLLVVEPEFARTLRVMARQGSILSAVIRQAWDSGDIRSLTSRKPIRATGVHISIIGHVTPDELRRYLTKTESGNGFANRFLWVCIGRSKLLPEGGAFDPRSIENSISKLMDAAEKARQTGRLHFDEDARALWHSIYASLSEGLPGLVGAVTSRAEAQTIRLACLYALLDGADAIGKRHLEAAIALWRYCERSARFIFEDVAGETTERLLDALREHVNGLSRTEVHSLFGRHRSAAEIDQAIRTLCNQGFARVEKKESGGRPTERLVLIVSAKKAN